MPRVKVRHGTVTITMKPEDVAAFLAAYPEAEVVEDAKAVRGPANDKAMKPAEDKGAGT